MINNTNYQTIHQMGSAINDVVRQATGRDNVQNIDMDYVTVARNHYAIPEEYTGSAVSFEAHGEFPMMVAVAVNLVQEGSGDPSPTNVRPITGRDSVKVSLFGKNVFDLENPTYPDTLVSDDGWFESDSNFDSWIFDKAGTWTISIRTTETAENGRCVVSPAYTGQPLDLSVAFSGYADVTSSITFTISEGKVACIAIRKSATNIQLEYGSVATEFENTSESVNTIQLPTTTYGGTLTINKDGTGTLTVDKVMVLVSDLTWTYDSQYTRFRTTCEGIKRGSVRTTPFITSAFISIDDGSSLANVPNNGIYAAGNTEAVYIKSLDYTSETDFVNAYGTQQIVYPLNEPVSYSVSVPLIYTRPGINTIYADTGNVTVQFTDIVED